MIIFLLYSTPAIHYNGVSCSDGGGRSSAGTGSDLLWLFHGVLFGSQAMKVSIMRAGQAFLVQPPKIRVAAMFLASTAQNGVCVGKTVQCNKEGFKGQGMMLRARRLLRSLPYTIVGILDRKLLVSNGVNRMGGPRQRSTVSWKACLGGTMHFFQ